MKGIWSTLGGEFLRVLVYNVVIAFFLSTVAGYALGVSLVYSNCIGLSIYALVRGSCFLRGQSRPGWLDAVVGIPLGFVLGFVLGTWANGRTLAYVLDTYPHVGLISGLTALLFGAIAIYHFHGQARIQEAEAQAQAERLQRTEQEALATHAELARLQAQIEPHFLFNTLSNVVGLIDTDPAAARSMLFDLTALLRTSLARSRRTDVSLGEELEMLRAYLGIMAIRMGPRLSWSVEADDDVLKAHLPPLLVQPLVENAIRHGLEPKPEGGRLAIRCRRQHDKVMIEVEDGGRGFGDGGSEGVGLANVRERLRACYGAGAALSLETNAAGGVTARLELPCAC
jgi:sensor histidine kinase YesM